MALHVEWDSKTYVYDPTMITVSQATAIQLHTGKSLRGWEEGCRDLDAPSVQALCWAMKAQAGETLAIASLDFPIFKFMEALGAAVDDSPEPAPDPPARVVDATGSSSTPTSEISGTATSG